MINPGGGRQKKRGSGGSGKPKVPECMVTFGDMITLMVTFFILLCTFARSQDAHFFADGIGASASFDIGDKASVSLNGMSFNYSVNLAIDENAPLRDLLGVSRLGLLNSLVEYRFATTFGLDAGDSRWSVSYARWKGAVDQGVTNSLTLRFLTPLGDSSDVELGLGQDSSESYGDVTFFSVFLYFYGGS